MKVYLETGGRGGSGKRIWGSSPLRFINTTRGPPATPPKTKLDDDDHDRIEDANDDDYDDNSCDNCSDEN